MSLVLSSPALGDSSPRQKFAPRSSLLVKQHSLWQIAVGVVRTLTWLEDGTTVITGLWKPGGWVGQLKEYEFWHYEI